MRFGYLRGYKNHTRIVLLAVILLSAASIAEDGSRMEIAISEPLFESTPLRGNIMLHLKEGELIPEDAILRIRLNDQKNDVLLSSLDIGGRYSNEGPFYLENFSLFGEGMGFGLSGSRETYPDVSFSLILHTTTAKYEQAPEGNDTDNDGITNDADNCPLHSNPLQQDYDSDGRGDECDPDRDGDGIINDADNCPFNYNPEQEDSDLAGGGDACDLDDDNDGIL